MRGLLASPLGFLIGVSLGALGGGGSILAVPALVYGAGQNPKAATATSLMLVGTAALVGMGAHHRAGRVRVGTGVVFGLAGIGGSLAGTALNRAMDPNLLLLGFSLLMLVAAWRMVTGCPTCTQVGEAEVLEQPDHDLDHTGTSTPHLEVSTGRRIDVGVALKILLAGTAVGFLTGLFGIGGGFVIVPALTLALGFSMPDAIGTSLLIIAINSAVALGSRLGTSTIDWAVAVPFTVAAVLGVLAGKRIADRLDARRSLRWFAALLVGLALYTAVQAGSALVA
jgi:uncharacterized membrane protein YfcA